MNHVLRHLRRAALLSAGDGPSDAQLLESFLARRDEAAFEALLRRHGPMVLGVCRDKQATEALERALKRLKEREKSRPPAEGNDRSRR